MACKWPLRSEEALPSPPSIAWEHMHFLSLRLAHEGLLLNIYLPQVRNESRQDTPSGALMAPDTRRCKANMIGETMKFLLRTPPTFTLSSSLHQASKASGRHPSCYPRVGSVQLFSGPLLLCPLAL
jgi:hypothetical protein